MFISNIICVCIYITSIGTLSNIIYQKGNDKPSLLLTDAVLHAGSEGGGVADVDGNLIGIVAPTLTRDTNINLEFRCLLPIHLCWHAMSRRGWVNGTKRPVFSRRFQMNRLSRNIVAGVTKVTIYNDTSCKSNNYNSDKALVAAIRHGVVEAEKSLVCLRVGKSWASGILLNNQGYILTCAHLLKPFLLNNSNNRLSAGYNVSARCDGSFIGIWQDAEVVYVCKKTIDVAIVKINNVPLGAQQIVFAPGEIIRGQAATVLGHALFEPALEIRPSISKGIISNVTWHNTTPSIVQSSACVYRGDSGGMLLDQHGQLIGMITSNAKQADNSIIPRINFSVPKNILLPLAAPKTLLSYIRSIDVIDDDLQALWNLEDVEDEPDLSHEQQFLFSKL